MSIVVFSKFLVENIVFGVCLDVCSEPINRLCFKTGSRIAAEYNNLYAVDIFSLFFQRMNYSLRTLNELMEFCIHLHKKLFLKVYG